MLSKEKIWSIIGVIILIAGVATLLVLRKPTSQSHVGKPPKTTSYSVSGDVVAIGKADFTLKQAWLPDHGDTSHLQYSDRKVTLTKTAKLYELTKNGQTEIKVANFFTFLKVGDKVAVFAEGDAASSDHTSAITATRVNILRFDK